MTHVQFAQPHWLWIGALCGVFTAILLARAARLRRRAAAALAGNRFVTTVDRRRRLAKQALVLAGMAAAFVALARPQAGFRWQEERRDGIDLMFAVDTSKSMLATDLRPDRLTRAKLAVSDLLRKFPGERVGLIAFAGEAFVQAPMTVDHAVFGEALEALDTSIIPRGGTDIASPIRAAVAAMATEPDRRKLLVILSDGEDLQGEALAAAKEAAHAGLVIYTVGVGTRAGDLIPIEHDGRRELLRDAEGRFVRSHLDEQTLRQLAVVTGGAYAPLGSAGRGLETLYRQHLAQLPRRTVEERMHKVYTERFQIPLAIALGCLMLELTLGDRRRRRPGASGPVQAAPTVRSTRNATKAAAAAAVLLLAGASRPARAATGSAPGASSYNNGTAAYRKNDFATARDRFQAATHTTDLPMQEDAYYDLGNARYRLGQATLSKDRPATIEAWKAAVAAYDGALALRPADADARFNRDLVARRLAALEAQQKQNQPQKDQPDRKDREDQKQGQGKQSQSSAGEQAQHGKQGTQGSQNGNPQSQQAQGSAGGQDQDKQPSSSAQSGQGQPQKGEAGSAGEPKQERASAQDGRQERSGKRERQSGQTGAAQSGPKGDQQRDQQRAQPDHPPPDQTAGGTQKTSPSQGAGVVSGPPGSQPAGKERAADRRRDPGALTASEAAQLLDSVSSELHRLPVADARRQQPGAREAAPDKDW
jgi:Ca-activated chloride channel family protein